MKVERTQRGFPVLIHPEYVKPRQTAICIQSSIILDYEDAYEKPGSSALWIGDKHHLNREEVGFLIQHLQSWLDTGSLEIRREECPTS